MIRPLRPAPSPLSALHREDAVTLVFVVAGLLVAVALVILLSARTLDIARSVIVHVPAAVAWSAVRDFGALHARHARGRSRLRIDTSSLVKGDGREPGSVWRQTGVLGGEPYWVEIELVAADPPRALVVRLLRDSRDIQRGLAAHLVEIQLVSEDAAETKLILHLRARLRGLRLPAMRRAMREQLRPLLLDLALRSVKVAIGESIKGRDECASEARAAVPPVAPVSAFAPPPRGMGDQI
jgi:hypothetical protein